MDRTIRRITGPEDIARQQKETYLYWASIPPESESRPGGSSAFPRIA